MQKRFFTHDAGLQISWSVLREVPKRSRSMSCRNQQPISERYIHARSPKQNLSWESGGPLACRTIGSHVHQHPTEVCGFEPDFVRSSKPPCGSSVARNVGGGKSNFAFASASGQGPLLFAIRRPRRRDRYVLEVTSRDQENEDLVLLLDQLNDGLSPARSSSITASACSSSRA